LLVGALVASPTQVSVLPYEYEMASSERRQLRFDLWPNLEAGEIIASVESVTLRNTATDVLHPDGLDGAAQITDGLNNLGETVPDSRVLQWVHDLEPDTKYEMVVTVVTSNGEAWAMEQRLVCKH
jgi:hypothetical protein